jgi:group I intron endonuclease
VFIYKITNNINSKIYIGLTAHNNPKDRWYRHTADARKGVDTYFYNAIRKYGKDNFTFEVILQAFDIEALNNFEIHFIKFYQSNNKKFGYNITEGGKYAKLTDETKNKLSKIMKEQFANGRKIVTTRPEGFVPWNKGKTYKTGRKLTQKQIETVRLANSKPKTEQHKQNLSKAKLDYHKTNEHHMSKKVLCVETNQVFDSAAKASKHFGFPFSAAARVANGNRLKYKGHTFVYIEDGEQ